MSEQSERVRYPVQHEKYISYFQVSAYCSVYCIKKIVLLPHKKISKYVLIYLSKKMAACTFYRKQFNLNELLKESTAMIVIKIGMREAGAC